MRVEKRGDRWELRFDDVSEARDLQHKLEYALDNDRIQERGLAHRLTVHDRRKPSELRPSETRFPERPNMNAPVGWRDELPSFDKTASKLADIIEKYLPLNGDEDE